MLNMDSTADNKTLSPKNKFLCNKNANAYNHIIIMLLNDYSYKKGVGVAGNKITLVGVREKN